MSSLQPSLRPSREIRIAQIVSRLNVGGPAIHTVMLANHFNQNNFCSILITGSPLENEGDMSYLLDREPAECHIIPSLQREINPIKDLRSLYHAYKILERFRPHIVHTHTAKAGVVGRIASFMLGIRNTLHTYHGHTFAHYFSPLKNRIFINIERALSHATSRLVAVSEQQVRDLAEVFRITSQAKIVNVPYGMKLDGYINNEGKRGYLRRKIAAEENEIVIGIVGRLYAIKAHDFFLYSASELLRKNKKIHFVVVGDGDERPNLEKIIEKENIRNNVHILGWEKDMESVYAGMDILALTSLNEGSPFSIIEGMASGLPVVSTSAGGVPDLFLNSMKKNDLRIAENGILVDKRDPVLFANALNILIEDSETRNRMGAKARKFVSARYTRERLLSDIEKIYIGLLPWAR